ncbi:hypothetical protein Tco_0463017 [Tanacetum coccineum]|uniref:Uncharacterized protein n=1 Tax=Tanacetum coccineum TaxID=301880 RepID=A0ABQ4WLA2_9ASTR
MTSSRFTWVKFLRSKDETPEFVTNFLKQIQVGLNKTVRFIRTDNVTRFVNQATVCILWKVLPFISSKVCSENSNKIGVVERTDLQQENSRLTGNHSTSTFDEIGTDNGSYLATKLELITSTLPATEDNAQRVTTSNILVYNNCSRCTDQQVPHRQTSDSPSSIQLQDIPKTPQSFRMFLIPAHNLATGDPGSGTIIIGNV